MAQASQVCLHLGRIPYSFSALYRRYVDFLGRKLFLQKTDKRSHSSDMADDAAIGMDAQGGTLALCLFEKPVHFSVRLPYELVLVRIRLHLCPVDENL